MKAFFRAAYAICAIAALACALAVGFGFLMGLVVGSDVGESLSRFAEKSQVVAIYAASVSMAFAVLYMYSSGSHALRLSSAEKPTS